MDTFTHYEYMKLALELAERGRFTVSPNPMVGCGRLCHR
jgi:diaminohydroxyphosphoribosylaminopyrimidine deaminase/5-amino-6-(5-phosphoribosylamino)uracil reductase